MVDKMDFVPGNPSNYTLRPLNKGVQVHLPPQLAEVGSFQDLQSYQPIPNGLQRRRSIQQYSSSSVDYPPISNVFQYFNTSTGLIKTLIVGQKFLYNFAIGSLSGLYWTYSTGTVAVSGTTLTGTSTSWDTEELMPGDIIVLDADGSGDGPEEVEISSIGSSATAATLASTPVGTYAAGTDYTIRRALGTPENKVIQGVVTADNEILIVDGRRAMYSYDGTTYGKAYASSTYIPTCIAYFRDRIFVGDITEAADLTQFPSAGGTRYRQRIRWTEPGVLNIFPSANYLDLPYQAGELIALVPMGNTLIAFYEDAVYLGTPSQIPTLPIYFQRISTGNIGLVGPRAYTQFFDSIFFVGADNIYQLSTSGIDPIGTPVVKKTIEESSNLPGIKVVSDNTHSRIVFGFTKDSGISELWSYDYRSKAWGMEKISCDELFSMTLYGGYTIDGLDSVSATIDGLDTYFPTIDSMTYSSTGGYDLYFAIGGSIYYQSEATTDYSGSIISRIETQDFDYGKPNMLKAFSRMSIKLESSISTDLTFSVYGSTDRGDSWTDLGDLTISAGDTEGKLNFQMMASLGRFLLVSQTDNEQYIINEIVCRIKLRGREARF